MNYPILGRSPSLAQQNSLSKRVKNPRQHVLTQHAVGRELCSAAENDLPAYSVPMHNSE
jgi:hypothetical protein